MSGKITIRLAVLGAIAALVAVLVPAGFAAGSHDGAGTVVGSGGFLYVDLERRGGEARWDGGAESFTSRPNSCTNIMWDSSDPDVIEIDAIPSDVAPDGYSVQTGFKDGQFGTLGPEDGSGEPCIRIDSPNQAIRVSLGADVPYLADAIDFDIEVKFGGTAAFTFVNSDTGDEVSADPDGLPYIFDPSDLNDDGPDSADGDNFRAFFAPEWDDDEDASTDPVPFYFDTVEITAVDGAVAFEGGYDGTQVPDEPSMDQTDNSSQFRLVKEFDGEITCGDTHLVTKTGVSVTGLVTVHAMITDTTVPSPTWKITNCLLKLYEDDVNATDLLFAPELANTQARYTIVITIPDQKITQTGGQITSLNMQYNPDGDPTPLQALLPCNGYPITDTGHTDYEAFWTDDAALSVTAEDLLPGTETACFYDVGVQVTGVNGSGEQVGTEIWKIFFEDDPFWGW